MIDCIEFNSEFRCVDVADELSFLQMECEMLNAGVSGERIARRCLQALGDQPPQELLEFYQSYRACVRAKVTALRSDQMPLKQELGMVSRAQQYLELADAHARGLRPPLLIVVRGVMGTGKTTLAGALAEAIGGEHLQTDAVRRELFGASVKPAGYNQDLYREENRRAVYEAMLARAEKLLAERIPAILDGTFFTAALQCEGATLAKQLQADALIVNCQCPDEVALQRIAARQQASDVMSEARPELFEKQKADQQVTPSEIRNVAVDTTKAVERNVDAVFADYVKSK